MTRHAPISSIYALGEPTRETAEQRRDSLMATALRRHKLAVIPLDDDRLDDIERRFIANVARKLTGVRI